MERLVIVAKNSLYTSTSNCKKVNASFQSFQIQKLESLKSEKDFLETKKWPCEATYQKFHSRILVLGILPLPSTFQIGSRVSTKTPSTSFDTCAETNIYSFSMNSLGSESIS
jgi:hypothetical protein